MTLLSHLLTLPERVQQRRKIKQEREAIGVEYKEICEQGNELRHRPDIKGLILLHHRARELAKRELSRGVDKNLPRKLWETLGQIHLVELHTNLGFLLNPENKRYGYSFMDAALYARDLAIMASRYRYLESQALNEVERVSEKLKLTDQARPESKNIPRREFWRVLALNTMPQNSPTDEHTLLPARAVQPSLVARRALHECQQMGIDLAE